VSGWKEAEYLEACEDNIFYNSIKATLQTGDFTEEELDDPTTRGEVVAAKYHLAGGCARWMFQFSSEQLLSPAGAIQSIENHVDRVSYHQIIDGFSGDRSSTEVNHLLSRIDSRAVIVSQYVANHLVLRFGEALLRHALILMGNSNPAMDGVLMVMDFILRLGRSTFKQKVSDSPHLTLRSSQWPRRTGLSRRSSTMAALIACSTAWASSSSCRSRALQLIRLI
jgi:hypothetical protein